jgi:hypothetical protein
MPRPLKISLLAMVLSSWIASGTARADHLVYHEIRTDDRGNIIPWYSSDPAAAYDHNLRIIWEFWKNMKSCPNGVKYFMQHQVWAHPVEDARGLGGDQLAMALSSWSLYYAYSGDRTVIDNMVYIADYYLAHALSAPSAAWPNLPYPYNTELHSGIFDGDMRAGKGYLQPDKAGSFGIELVVLYQITGKPQYLKAAIAIADTLADKVTPGDENNSPWPYRVDAATGKVNRPYTTNWTGTIRLFDELIRLNQGKVASYADARAKASAWLRNFPMKNNRWGPFFEDVADWSDTEINADTLAWYILEHPVWDPNWRQDSKAILDWTRAMFGNPAWLKYGVTAINEQTAYPVPGNSHTSRHASVQLLYAEKTGDFARKAEAIRQLNWATYMVGDYGNNCYPFDNVWLTDGYGDYVRHYLRAMAAAPELSPRDQSHLLRSRSAVRSISYGADSVSYETADRDSRELLRIAFKPARVAAGGITLPRLNRRSDLDHSEGYTFEAPGDLIGVLRIRHDKSGSIEISGKNPNYPPIAWNQEIAVFQNGRAEIRLAATDEQHTSRGGTLKFTMNGPYHGKITGTPPDLAYVPAPDFLGNDVLTFVANDGELDSNVAQVTIAVIRQNLARAPGAFSFTTENPRTGAAGIFHLSALIDGKVAGGTSVAAEKSAEREVGVGIAWPEPQEVRQVAYHNGIVTEDGNGSFNGTIRLQVSTDGNTWQEAPDCTLSPGYSGGALASMREYTFTLADRGIYRGVRVVGRVGGSAPGASRFPRVREIQVFPELMSTRGPRIESSTEDQIVAEGDTANFGVRMRGWEPVAYQWQVSRDQGQTWASLAGANSMFLAVEHTAVTAHGGNLYRCVVSNGTADAVIGKPISLTVTPAGSGHSHVSRNPLKPQQLNSP